MILAALGSRGAHHLSPSPALPGHRGGRKRTRGCPVRLRAQLFAALAPGAACLLTPPPCPVGIAAVRAFVWSCACGMQVTVLTPGDIGEVESGRVARFGYMREISLRSNESTCVLRIDWAGVPV